MTESKPTPHGADPGEMMNVREVHGAILRERSLPGETMRRIPWYLHLLYFGLALWALIYLLTYSANFSWNEYEQRPDARAKREYLERKAGAEHTPARAAIPKP